MLSHLQVFQPALGVLLSISILVGVNLLPGYWDPLLEVRQFVIICPVLLNMVFTLLYHHLQTINICQQLKTDKKHFLYWIYHYDGHRTSWAKRKKAPVNERQKTYPFSISGVENTSKLLQACIQPHGGVLRTRIVPFLSWKRIENTQVWGFCTPVSIRYILHSLNQKRLYRLVWQKSSSVINGMIQI